MLSMNWYLFQKWIVDCIFGTFVYDSFHENKRDLLGINLVTRSSQLLCLRVATYWLRGLISFPHYLIRRLQNDTSSHSRTYLSGERRWMDETGVNVYTSHAPSPPISRAVSSQQFASVLHFRRATSGAATFSSLSADVKEVISYSTSPALFYFVVMIRLWSEESLCAGSERNLRLLQSNPTIKALHLINAPFLLRLFAVATSKPPRQFVIKAEEESFYGKQQSLIWRVKRIYLALVSLKN